MEGRHEEPGRICFVFPSFDQNNNWNSISFALLHSCCYEATCAALTLFIKKDSRRRMVVVWIYAFHLLAWPRSLLKHFGTLVLWSRTVGASLKRTWFNHYNRNNNKNYKKFFIVCKIWLLLVLFLLAESAIQPLVLWSQNSLFLIFLFIAPGIQLVCHLNFNLAWPLLFLCAGKMTRKWAVP